mgnify:FL=1
MSEVFSSEEIEEIKTNCKDLHEGESYSNNQDLRKSFIQWIYRAEQTNWIYERIYSAVNSLNENYFKFDIDSLEDIQFTEYDESYEGAFGRHTDDDFIENITRKLSFSIQMSDPTDYEGGELQIYRFGSEGILAPKEKGTLILFPSFTIHEVTPVIKGHRKSLVGWCHGPRWK